MADLSSDLALDATSSAGGDGAPAAPASQPGDTAAYQPLGFTPDGVTNGRYDPAAFTALDFYRVDDLLTDDEKALRDRIRDYVTSDVLPVIEQHAQAMTFPREIGKGLAELGAIGPTIPTEYGGLGASSVAYGLAMQEVERADSGLRSFCSVMGSLVMYPIYTYGSEAQKRRWLPQLAAADALGCFRAHRAERRFEPGRHDHARRPRRGFLRPHRPQALEHERERGRRRRRVGQGRRGRRARLPGRDRPGGRLDASDHATSGRCARRSRPRSSSTTCACPRARCLPNVKGLKGPLSCLTQARYGIAWGVIGAALSCYDAAIQHTTSREQFGKPDRRASNSSRTTSPTCCPRSPRRSSSGERLGPDEGQWDDATGARLARQARQRPDGARRRADEPPASGRGTACWASTPSCAT